MDVGPKLERNANIAVLQFQVLTDRCKEYLGRFLVAVQLAEKKTSVSRASMLDISMALAVPSQTFSWVDALSAASSKARQRIVCDIRSVIARALQMEAVLGGACSTSPMKSSQASVG